ncbi:glycosyltransferase [Phycicoccus flavus]|uniref:glycosyltransferase n=1 Tax=Phycicoccus flavus TaxID=2502783 RepID=UPI000FEBCF1D|nr:glycosyltransferase [Phycicoccus flavus]
MSAVRHVLVVVPARDEEQVLGPCLRSLEVAAARLRRARPDVAVDVVVVLDGCVDGSAAVTARYPVTAFPVLAGTVGAARRLGVRGGLALRPADIPNEAVWIASTDADCEVPPHWLTEQVALAEGGADLVVGTVVPAGDLDPVRLAEWHSRHDLRDGHPYVHGANLGVRLTAYAAAGGFRRLVRHEDVGLVRRVRALGHPWVATDRTRVRTSPRLQGRVEGGFAGYLAALPGTDPAPARRARTRRR